MNKFRFGVLASGGGSNLQVLMDKINCGDLPAELSFVLSNNSKCKALARAREFGVPAYHVSAVTAGSEPKAEEKILEIIRSHEIELLVLAGYMKKIPPSLLVQLKNRIVNIHPALLPAFGGEGFYGKKVHEVVLARGAQFTGVTVHMVNEQYDEGQIILQRVISVPVGCTTQELAEKVLIVEHDSLWRVVKAFALGEIVPTESNDAARAVMVGTDFYPSLKT